MSDQTPVQTTQTAFPWRTVIRSAVQFAIGLAALLATFAITDGMPAAVVTAITVSAAVTRFMALPQVESFLKATPWLSWLAASK